MDADAVGPDDSDPADEDIVATDTAAQAPGPVETRPVVAIEDVPAPSEQPAAKRQRVLRMMNSEEVPETEDQDAALFNDSSARDSRKSIHVIRGTLRHTAWRARGEVGLALAPCSIFRTLKFGNWRC